MQRRFEAMFEWFSLIFVPIVVVGLTMLGAVGLIWGSVAGMQFQQTHPLTRAKVLSVFTRLSSMSDAQTGISTTLRETCAQRISFSANGQNMELDVRHMQACPLRVGDQPRIAYDPGQPTHIQFVPGGDPFWGNLLQIVLGLALFGGALVMGIEHIRFPNAVGARVSSIFWGIVILCFFALAVMGAISRNP